MIARDKDGQVIVKMSVDDAARLVEWLGSVNGSIGTNLSNTLYSVPVVCEEVQRNWKKEWDI